MSMSSRKLHPLPATQFSFIQYRKYTTISALRWKEREIDSKLVVDIVHNGKWDSAEVNLRFHAKIAIRVWISLNKPVEKRD